ncbi:hypothetical protein F5Y05DRAFT_408700 [Hypoxylon sp. FL0543]|nr:hypothetical protein F5Y05DRAFT_408700 [Hypoxylon sp. FL0543]
MAEEMHGEMKANIGFLQWDDLYNIEKPFQITTDIPVDAEDKRSSNLSFETKRKLIRDIRHLEAPPILDDCGFTLRHRPSRLIDFSSKEKITSTYLPEVEEVIRSELDNVEKVFIFDWRLRSSEPLKADTVVDFNNPMHRLLPSENVHVDQSATAVIKRIRLHFPDEAEALLRGRIRVINVWRPIGQAVTDWPMAFCDAKTVSDSDLVETDHIRRRYVGATIYLLDRPQHSWYYVSNQTPEEIIIFKNFDTSEHVRARYSPHAAFKIPDRIGGMRRSIEVRALVFGPSSENQGLDSGK